MAFNQNIYFPIFIYYLDGGIWVSYTFGGCWSPLPSSDENHRSQEVDDPSKILQIEADVDRLLNVENKAPRLMNLT